MNKKKSTIVIAEASAGNDETALTVKTAESVSELDARLQKEFKRRVSIIHKQVDNIQRSFVSIAFQLHWIRERNMFKLAGCKNIYEYADQEFGIGRSSCGNLIYIVEHYANRDENGNIIESIAEQYQGYSAYQLVAMIGLSDEAKALITPDMSTRAILKMKKEEQLALASRAASSRRLESGGTVINVSAPESKPSADDAPPWDNSDSMPDSVVKMEAASERSESPKVDTLLTFGSFADYQKEIERIGSMVARAFDSENAVTVKIICEQT